MLDLDAIKTIVDTGCGAVALAYVHKLSKLLEKHETRITSLEKSPWSGRWLA